MAFVGIRHRVRRKSSPWPSFCVRLLLLPGGINQLNQPPTSVSKSNYIQPLALYPTSRVLAHTTHPHPLNPSIYHHFSQSTLSLCIPSCAFKNSTISSVIPCGPHTKQTVSSLPALPLPHPSSAPTKSPLSILLPQVLSGNPSLTIPSPPSPLPFPPVKNTLPVTPVTPSPASPTSLTSLGRNNTSPIPPFPSGALVPYST